MKKLENLSRKAVTSKSDAPKIVTLSNDALSTVVGGAYSGGRSYERAY